MKREEVIAILGIMKTAYPRFYANMSKNQAEETIALWHEMFKSDNPLLVTNAVKKLITELEFPPTIADVKKSMYSITDRSESNIELWNIFFKAISNSGYNSVQEFEKLPDILKKFAGSPSQMRDYALMDRDTVNSVVKGQFLKHIDILKEREKENKMMLPEVRDLVKQLASGMGETTEVLSLEERIALKENATNNLF